MSRADAAGSLRNLNNFTIARKNSAFNEITAVSAASAGSGQTDGTRTWTVTDGTGTEVATFSATVSGGAITGGITVISGGRYSVNPDTTANATCTVDSGTTNATFNLTMGTLADATLDVASYNFDGPSGRLYLAADAADFDDDDTLNIGYKKLAATRETIASSGTPITGSLRYMSANASGVERNYYFPKVEIAADGDFSAIGQEWQQMSFAVDALQISTGAARCLVDGNPLTA